MPSNYSCPHHRCQKIYLITFFYFTQGKAEMSYESGLRKRLDVRNLKQNTPLFHSTQPSLFYILQFQQPKGQMSVFFLQTGQSSYRLRPSDPSKQQMKRRHCESDFNNLSTHRGFWSGSRSCAAGWMAGR